MSNFIPNKEFLHSILLFYFHANKSATDSFDCLQRVYGKNSLPEQKCKKLFGCFKRRNYVFKYDEKSSEEEEKEEEVNDGTEEPGTSKEINDCEEINILSQFLNKVIENSKNGSVSKSRTRTYIVHTLLKYFHVKRNDEKSAESKKYLKNLYGSFDLAMKACKDLMNQVKRNINFECIELPQYTMKLKLLTDPLYVFSDDDDDDEKKVSPPIYYSESFKNKMYKKKCDCRINKTRKILVPSPKRNFLRKLLLHSFNMNETTFECFDNLFKVYGDQVPSEKTCKIWFKRFKNNNFVLNEEKRSGRKKKFEDINLDLLLNEKMKKSQKEIADLLGVTKQAVSYRIKKK